MSNTNPKTKRTTRRRGRMGSAMLETAFVMITVMGMVIFIVEMGRFLMVQQFAVERAREVARLAVVNNWTSVSVANYVAYGSTTAPTGQPSGYLGITPSNVSYSTLGTAGQPDYRVKLIIQNMSAVVFIPGMANTYAIPAVTVVVPAQSMGASN